MRDAPSGIRLDRRALLASGVAVAAGLAGCNEESGDRADPGDTVSYVPASASAVVGADMALTEDEETRALLEAYAGEDDEDVLERVESRTGVDPQDVDEVLTYSEEPGAEERTLVVDGDFDAQELADAAEEDRGVEYETVEFDKGTLYEPTGGDGDEPWVGTAAEGQYVVGAEEDVRTALDVFAGDEDGFGDPLRGAFEDARTYDESGDDDGGATADGEGNESAGGDGSGDEGGDGTPRQYVTSATDQPRAYLPDDDSDRVPAGASLALYEELETATATYAVADGEVAIDVEMQAPDEDTAGSVAEFTRTIVSILQNSVQDEAVAAELDEATVERDGSVATVAYRSDAEGAATLAAWLAQM